VPCHVDLGVHCTEGDLSKIYIVFEDLLSHITEPYTDCLHCPLTALKKCMIAMLMLLRIGDYEVETWSSLQWHAVCTVFNDHPLIGEKVIKNEDIHIRTRECHKPVLTNYVAPEPEGSSPHSQQPSNGPYPEPGESTQHPRNRSPEGPF
jgi:hypothetical protein